MNLAYKIISKQFWNGLLCSGDLKDKRTGFIHLSTRSQLANRMKKYVNRRGHVLLCIDLLRIPHGKVKWEGTSTGTGPSSHIIDAPHIYGKFGIDSVVWSKKITRRLIHRVIHNS